MRNLIATAALLLLAPFAQADDKKDTIAAAKVSAAGLKKDWCLSAVSAKPRARTGVVQELAVLVRFDKDVSRSVAQEVKESMAPLRSAPRAIGFKYENLVVVRFLDEDNVVLQVQRVQLLEGGVTGRAGEGFRIITQCTTDVSGKVKRIEVSR